jgi:hypothetical protein
VSYCANYTNTDTGTGVYSNWNMPTKDELNLMYANLYKKGLGDFNIYPLDRYGSGGFYWSSKVWTSTANYLVLTSGDWYYQSKSDRQRVRAVRDF